MSLPPTYTGTESLLEGGQGAAPPIMEMRGGARGLRWANNAGKPLEAVRHFRANQPAVAFEGNEPEYISLNDVIGPLPEDIKDSLKRSQRKYIIQIDDAFYIRRINRFVAPELDGEDEDVLENLVDTYNDIKGETVGSVISPMSGEEEEIVTLKPKLVRSIVIMVGLQANSLKKHGASAERPLVGGAAPANTIGPLPEGIRDDILRGKANAQNIDKYFQEDNGKYYIAKLNDSGKTKQQTEDEQSLESKVAEYNNLAAEMPKTVIARSQRTRRLDFIKTSITGLVRNQLKALKKIGKLNPVGGPIGPIAPAPAVGPIGPLASAPAVGPIAPAPVPVIARPTIRLATSAQKAAKKTLLGQLELIRKNLTTVGEALNVTPINYADIVPPKEYTLTEDLKAALKAIRASPTQPIPTNDTIEKLLGVVNSALKYAAELKKPAGDLNVNVNEALKTLKGIGKETKSNEITKGLYSGAETILTKIGGLLGGAEGKAKMEAYFRKIADFLFRLPTLKTAEEIDAYYTPMVGEAAQINTLLKGNPALNTNFTPINTLFTEIVTAKKANPSADTSKKVDELEAKLTAAGVPIKQTSEEEVLSKQLEEAGVLINKIKASPITKDNLKEVSEMMVKIKGIFDNFADATKDIRVSIQLETLYNTLKAAHEQLLAKIGSVDKSMKDLEAGIAATSAAEAGATAAQEATKVIEAATEAIQKNTDPTQTLTIISTAEKAMVQAKEAIITAEGAAAAANTAAVAILATNPAESAAASAAAKKATDAAVAATAAIAAAEKAKTDALGAMTPENATSVAKEAAVAAEAAAASAEAAATAAEQAAAKAATANSDEAAAAAKEAQAKHQEASDAALVAKAAATAAAAVANKSPEAAAAATAATAAATRADVAAKKAAAASSAASSIITIRPALAAAKAALEAADVAAAATKEADATTDSKEINNAATKAEAAAAAATAAAQAASDAAKAASAAAAASKDPIFFANATAAAKQASEAAEKAAAAAKAATEAAVKLRTPPVAPPGTPSDDYSNAAIRGRLAPETRAKFAQALNIYGDKFDLNSSIEYQYSHKPLKRFLTDYGIGPDYQDHTDAIIRAFFTVFPNPSSGLAAGPADKVHEMPEFHVICAFLQYRILTLRFEIQLTMRSTERRTSLEHIVKKLQNLLKGGKCGSINTALALETMKSKEEYDKATAAAKTAPSAKLTDMNEKLDKILGDLAACCEKLSKSLEPGGTFSKGVIDDINKIVGSIRATTTVTATGAAPAPVPAAASATGFAT